jgi:D-hydroxyproline dehydrogenase subunit beta
MGRTRAEIAVVGAGIIGSACAMELARRDHDVLLLEAVDVAAETSCRAMGHLGVYDDSPAQLALTVYAMQCWRDIAPSLTREVEYRPRGAIWVAETDADVGEIQPKADLYRSVGVETKVLDASALHEAEPNLAPDLPGGLLVPSDVVLDASEATKFLARRSQELGAELQVGAQVRSLENNTLRLETGETVHADQIVVAAGWQSPRIVPGLPMRSRKGHIAQTVAGPDVVHHQLSEIGYTRTTAPSSGDSISFALQPRVGGRCLIGATRQYVGDSTVVDPTVVERLLARARRFVPSLASIGIERTWAGLRPAGPDDVPLIGPLPSNPHVFLATAHEGIGITSSIATGRLIADQIEGKPSPIDLGPYLPSRSIDTGRSA